MEEFLKSHRYVLVDLRLTSSLDQHLAVDMTDDIGRLLDQYRQSYGKTMDEADEAKLKAYYYTFEFNSPYAEVRASVPNTDDLSLPVETFRAYFLGILFAGTCSAMNQVPSSFAKPFFDVVLCTPLAIYCHWWCHNSADFVPSRFSTGQMVAHENLQTEMV